MKLSDEILEWANEGIAAFEPVTRLWSTRVAELEAQLAECQRGREALREAMIEIGESYLVEGNWRSLDPMVISSIVKYAKLAATKEVSGE